MAECIVMDAGPLILLAKIDALEILPTLPFQYVAPPNVFQELATGMAYGHPAVDAPWLQSRRLREPLPEYIRTSLDDDEAAATHLAKEQNIRFICLDDRRGRRMAKALGLEVVGLLGLLIHAKRQGTITALRPYTDKLLAAGARYSPVLVQEVLFSVGE